MSDMSIEEREKALDGIAQKELDKKMSDGNIAKFLEKGERTDTQAALRKKVFDEYIADKIKANPSIALVEGTIEDFYSVGLSLVQAQSEAGAAAAASEGTPAPGTSTSGTIAPVIPKATTGGTGSGTSGGAPVSVEEVISKSGLSKQRQKGLANALRMHGITVDEIK